MQLLSPFEISSRLMPALRVGGATISMGIGPRNGEGRTCYQCWIDLPDGTEHEVTDLRSGCGGGELQGGFTSLLSFLSAAAESFQYAGMDGENSGIFTQPVTEWAAQFSDEISMLAIEIEEAGELILA